MMRRPIATGASLAAGLIAVSGSFAAPASAQELDVPMRDDAVFEIGSATKQFTAAAILRLAEEGMLDLDHLLTEYLPRYPLRGNAVTLRQLLDHRSGIRGYTEIPDFWEMDRQSLPRDSLVRLFHEPLLNQLGYRLLRHGRTGDAIAIFRLNVREYPEAPFCAQASREVDR